MGRGKDALSETKTKKKTTETAKELKVPARGGGGELKRILQPVGERKRRKKKNPHNLKKVANKKKF